MHCYVALDILGPGFQDTNAGIYLAYRNCMWEWVIQFHLEQSPLLQIKQSG